MVIETWFNLGLTDDFLEPWFKGKSVVQSQIRLRLADNGLSLVYQFVYILKIDKTCENIDKLMKK